MQSLLGTISGKLSICRYGDVDKHSTAFFKVIAGHSRKSNVNQTFGIAVEMVLTQTIDAYSVFG